MHHIQSVRAHLKKKKKNVVNIILNITRVSHIFMCVLMSITCFVFSIYIRVTHAFIYFFCNVTRVTRNNTIALLYCCVCRTHIFNSWEILSK